MPSEFDNVVFVTGDNVTLGTGRGTIDGNRATQTASQGVTINGVEVRSCSGATVRAGRIKDCAHQAVLLENVTDALVEDDRIDSCGPPTHTNAKAIVVYYNYGASAGVTIRNNRTDGGGVSVVAVGAITHRRISVDDNQVVVGDAGGETFTLGVEFYCNTGGAIHGGSFSENIIEAENNTNANILGVSLSGSVTSVAVGSAAEHRPEHPAPLPLAGHRGHRPGHHRRREHRPRVRLRLRQRHHNTGGIFGATVVNTTLHGTVSTDYALVVERASTARSGLWSAGTTVMAARVPES